VGLEKKRQQHRHCIGRPKLEFQFGISSLHACCNCNEGKMDKSGRFSDGLVGKIVRSFCFRQANLRMEQALSKQVSLVFSVNSG
jgi:hypothetical protein